MITQRAALPPHRPGVVVTISLDQLPDYLERNGLRAMGLGEVNQLEQRTGTRKEAGVLWVRLIEHESIVQPIQQEDLHEH